MMNKLKNLNLKSVLRGFALVWMLALIVFMTITNVGIDDEFNLLKWVGNSMILFGITVFGLFIGESIGVDRQKERVVRDGEGNIVGGLYQKNLQDYNVFRKLVNEIIIYFPLFYNWFVPQRLESKKINYLIMNNVRPVEAERIVKYCTIDDYEELTQHLIVKVVDGEEIPVAKLVQDELDPVREVLSGQVKLELSGTAYYLQAFATSNNKDIIEQGEAYRKARKFNKSSSRAIRLVSGAFISFGIGILAVNDFISGDDMQAWLNLVIRIANLFTAIVCGWISGAIDVKLEAQAIANKTEVLGIFKSAYEKHLFPIYDEEEKIKQEWEQYQKEKEEAEQDNSIELLSSNDV